MDRAEVVRGQCEVGGDGIIVGRAVLFAAGGGAFSGKVAEALGDDVDLAVEIAGFVAEAVGGFHDVDPDGKREGGAVAAFDGLLRLVEANPDRAG